VQVTGTRRTVRVRLTIAAWITILILTGAFQFYRAAVPDAIAFLAMAAALVVGETGLLRRFDRRPWHPRRLVVGALLAVDAVVLLFTPRHGFADGIAIAVSGVLVFLVAWPNHPTQDHPLPPWTPRLTRAAIAWAILGIAFCIWELAMYFLGYGAEGRTEYPALSDILDPVLNNPVGRFVGVAAWLAGGIALTRRGRTAP
jgi:hypothetical protein